jgi:aspartate 1-decarboxylase
MMMIEVVKSKIHRVTVTSSNLDYMGSISIDPTLLEAVNIIPGEKVQVLSIEDGARLETYVIEGESGSGEIIINGPAALKIKTGSIIIIISYILIDINKAKKYQPKIIFPKETTNKL